MTPKQELHRLNLILRQLMYAVVWEGKALSGREVLVNGEDISTLTVSPVEPA